MANICGHSYSFAAALVEVGYKIHPVFKNTFKFVYVLYCI